MASATALAAPEYGPCPCASMTCFSPWERRNSLRHMLAEINPETGLNLNRRRGGLRGERLIRA
eukprot:3120006-Pyramimonas_sp.AAC.1